ncbi:ubiquitin-conjugating enzyme E2-binding protein [Coniochaeta sp. 2T2.1]|nr:ubiquitin-conjugating enzyme E2-binding protein [Coniochaeta sp. 2T2.1]
MSTPITIYAELLSNIRQISLAVSLPSPSDPSSKITLSHTSSPSTSPSSSISISHGNQAVQLLLPGPVSYPGHDDLPIQRRSADGLLLTWRLPLLLSPAGGQVGQRVEAGGGGGGSSVPWEAKDLLPGGAVACRKCKGVVVEGSKVKEWKDLPAKGWAEMMEFWHCHKPGEEHHGHGHGHGHGVAGEGKAEGEDDVDGEGEKGVKKADEATLASRGYGAASSISAQRAVGFVDLTTVLFEEGDCGGILFSHSSPNEGLPSRAGLPDIPSTTSNIAGLNIFCSNCHTRIGYYSHKTSAVTLFKWHLSLPTSSPSQRQPTIPECLSSTLQATLLRTGSSKSLLLPINHLPSPFPSPTPSSPAIPPSSRPPAVLHFQILNPSLAYSSSSLPQQQRPVPAMKLLWREITRQEADRILDDINSDVQEVNLPEEALGVVREELNTSNGLLPETERMYREWGVGMLRRWEG